MFRNYRRGLLGAVALLSVGLGGCTDPTVAPKSTISETTVFDSPASYRAFLAKLYGGLILSGIRGCCDRDIGTISDAGFQSYIRIYWQAQELPTDEAMLRWANDGPILEFNAMTWGSTNEFVSGMFARIFFQISTANEFLRQTTDGKLDERGVSGQLRNDIRTFRAEARFLRALSYWHGIDMYGPIPIVTEPSGTPPDQATRTQVYDFIVSELNAILPDLPPAAGQATYARATQEAAHMLLAHVHLNAEVYTGTGHYAEALAEAEAVINSGKYTLNPVFQNNFTADNHISPEIIFPLVSDGQFSRGYGGTTFLVHAACYGYNGVSTDPNGPAYGQEPSTLGVGNCWYGLKVRPEAFQRLQNDPRGLLFVTGRTPLSITTITSEGEGAASVKFTNLTSTGTQGSSGEWPDTDYPMFRLADAYLIYAEAALRGGGGSAAQALTYVNALRQRAYGDNSGDITQGELTLDFLLDERGRELFFEGQRRTDLIRFGKFTGNSYIWTFKGGVPAGQSVPAHVALYPIPSNQIAVNPKLSQNPGY